MTEAKEPPELYLKYRPTKFSEMVGQRKMMKMLDGKLKRKEFPHALLLTGPSGTGKTTLARIIAAKLKCVGSDFHELNAAQERGIDMVRGISQRVGLSPLSSPCRVWLIDEAHALTPDAQGAFLKMLEDTPSHAYFFLATTDPQKLKETVKGRCTDVVCTRLKFDELEKLIRRVVAAEGAELEDEVIEKVAQLADGSARKALVLLGQAISEESTEAQLDVIRKADVETDAFQICRLLNNSTTVWSEVAKLLDGVEDDPEGIRYMILGYFRKVALGQKDPARAVSIIETFQYDFYTSKAAGLAAACYSVVSGGK